MTRTELMEMTVGELHNNALALGMSTYDYFIEQLNKTATGL